MGLLRNTEDSRPLVHNNACSPTSDSTQTISDGYVNEAICEADLKLISAKFGDSCRKSLTSVMEKSGGGSGGGGGASSGIGGGTTHDGCEFDFKKNFLRETSSGKFISSESTVFWSGYITQITMLHAARRVRVRLPQPDVAQ